MSCSFLGVSRLFFVVLTSVGFGEEKLFSGLQNVLLKISAALGQFWWHAAMAFLVQSSYLFSLIVYNQNPHKI
jgi:hypothetical protein